MASPDDRVQVVRPLRAYTTVVSVLGIGLLAWSLSTISPSLPGVLLFVVLVAIAEWTNIEVFASKIAVSISSAVTFATLLLYGPLSSALVGIAGGLVATAVNALVDRRQGKTRGTHLLGRALFNMAALGIASGVAGGFYLLSGGRVGEVALLSNLLPAVLAAVLAELVNAAIVVGAVSLQTGQPAFRLWRQNVSWAIPMNILGMAIGGSGLALGYQIAGILGVAVFFLPVLLTIYAYRLYVRRTEAQMARVEELVAERVKALHGENGSLETA